MRPALALLLLLLVAPAASPQSGDDITDESTPEYRKALELFRKGQWISAQKAFRALLGKYPFSVHASEAEVRSDDNCYLGVTRIFSGGPSAKRIDVAVMGDGFTIDPPDQALQEKWAKLCVDVLFNEKSFAEYRDAFNIWFVRLASLEEGVDPQISEAERAKIEERNRRRVRKRRTDYSTALDCKA
ncbi:MAG: M64 family metallo-endopeptidase, partial [Planctomycetes bacterium]|nr:M64 family metallo-endopeptidase [Planctomycetota bacterium]